MQTYEKKTGIQPMMFDFIIIIYGQTALTDLPKKRSS